jgi:hypothetical protein
LTSARSASSATRPSTPFLFAASIQALSIGLSRAAICLANYADATV